MCVYNRCDGGSCMGRHGLGSPSAAILLCNHCYGTCGCGSWDSVPREVHPIKSDRFVVLGYTKDQDEVLLVELVKSSTVPFPVDYGDKVWYVPSLNEEYMVEFLEKYMERTAKKMGIIKICVV